PNNIDIYIEYNPPKESSFAENQYDLLIITNEKFLPYLEPLVEHKNRVGIKTTVETVQDIYPNYNGRDDAEDVKLAIADAIKNWGIKYVLLFGGHKGQTEEWWVPVRYSNNFDGAYSHSGIPYDPKYLSDLYFADVYKYENGNVVFEDWDSNGNGIFAEWSNFVGKKDIIDYHPDVYVGRIPVRYSWEAEIVVDKIITYETTASASWFKDAVVCSGDTFPPSRGASKPIYEGELEVSETADYLESAGFNVERLFTSTGTFSSREDLQMAVNAGCGFVHVAGHGSPSVWGNFLPDAQTEEEFVTGFSIMNIHKFTTGYMLPVIVIGGCHNAQFNVTIQEIIDNRGINYSRYPFEGYLPCDTASWWLLQKGGGSIGSIGNTALGYGYIDEYSTYGLGGWIEPRFFYEYAVAGLRHLGELHGQAITDYVNMEGPYLGDVNEDQIDRKTIEEWALLGDPSLKLGGYGGSLDVDDDGDGSDPPFSTTPIDTPDWDVGDKWRYRLTDVDFVFSEIEDRSVYFHLSSGDLTLEVTDASSGLYVTEVSANNLESYLNVTFDPHISDVRPIHLKLKILDASINGEVAFDQTDLGILRLNLLFSGALDTKSLLESFDITLPSFILKLVRVIPFKVSLQLSFDKAYEIFGFPLTVGKTWSIPEGEIHIDGSIQARYLRLLKIADTLLGLFGMHLLPPEIKDNLPVIDISKLLEELIGDSTIHIPETPKLFRSPVFTCSRETRINVEAGSFDTTVIEVIDGILELYYSPDAENFVRIQGNLKDFIPITNNIKLDLIEH
ncbi:MAG TPA: hypothetical protein ENI44_04900, partial [Thermoplasmatales archaeon]|nr:hypothetical protein [Thermoplasmatales archaeon]